MDLPPTLRSTHRAPSLPVHENQGTAAPALVAFSECHGHGIMGLVMIFAQPNGIWLLSLSTSSVAKPIVNLQVVNYSSVYTYIVHIYIYTYVCIYVYTPISSNFQGHKNRMIPFRVPSNPSFIWAPALALHSPPVPRSCLERLDLGGRWSWMVTGPPITCAFVEDSRG